MNSDTLLLLIIPFTAAATWIAYGQRRGKFISRVYMLVVFSIAGLASLGYVPLDAETRVFLLRCGWLTLVLDEVITWARTGYGSQEVKDARRTPH